MPAPRFRVRTLMIAVAAVGLALAGVRETFRFYEFWQDHRMWVAYDSTEKSLLDGASSLEAQGKHTHEYYKSVGVTHLDKYVKESAEKAAEARRFAQKLAREKAKYQHAAKFPW